MKTVAIATGFLGYLQRAWDDKMLKAEPGIVYDSVRRCYLNEELKSKISAGNPDAEQMQLSGEGPNFYEFLGHWYTFCDSNNLDITQPPPERAT